MRLRMVALNFLAGAVALLAVGACEGERPVTPAPAGEVTQAEVDGADVGGDTLPTTTRGAVVPTRGSGGLLPEPSNDPPITTTTDSGPLIPGPTLTREPDSPTPEPTTPETGESG